LKTGKNVTQHFEHDLHFVCIIALLKSQDFMQIVIHLSKKIHVPVRHRYQLPVDIINNATESVV